MSKTTDASALDKLGQGLAAVAARLEAAQAGALCGKAAAALIQNLRQTEETSGTERISTVLRREGSDRARSRFLAVAATVGCLTYPSHVLVVPALLQPATKPLPPPLPAQVLIDLLKHPLCVRAARRAVLDQLSRHFRRPFADQWDFVEYVRQQKLDLDLASPPPWLREH
jgi:hypothetical protein